MFSYTNHSEYHMFWYIGYKKKKKSFLYKINLIIKVKYLKFVVPLSNGFLLSMTCILVVVIFFFCVSSNLFIVIFLQIINVLLKKKKDIYIFRKLRYFINFKLGVSKFEINLKIVKSEKIMINEKRTLMYKI